MRSLVIIPAYNERDSILQVVAEMQSVAPQADYLVINDGSTDDTLDLLVKEGIPYLDLPINLGVGGVVQTGYLYALNHGYDFAVQLDGDGQHDPACLAQILAKLADGDVDLVIASRFLGDGSYRSTWLRRWGIRLISTVIRLCSGVVIRDVTSGYRGVNRKLMEFYARNYAQDYPEPEAILAAALAGFTLAEIPTVMRPRQRGVSSIDGPAAVYYMVKVILALLLLNFKGLSGSGKAGG